ncbi:MAG: SufS family cysteine desulfurase [Planctomycetaceae bacterium]|nr:SufS family cysteine desulfurase [Planctomycetaceae bacterium]
MTDRADNRDDVAGLRPGGVPPTAISAGGDFFPESMLARVADEILKSVARDVPVDLSRTELASAGVAGVASPAAPTTPFAAPSTMASLPIPPSQASQAPMRVGLPSSTSIPILPSLAPGLSTSPQSIPSLSPSMGAGPVPVLGEPNNSLPQVSRPIQGGRPAPSLPYSPLLGSAVDPNVTAATAKPKPVSMLRSHGSDAIYPERAAPRRLSPTATAPLEAMSKLSCIPVVAGEHQPSVGLGSHSIPDNSDSYYFLAPTALLFEKAEQIADIRSRSQQQSSSPAVAGYVGSSSGNSLARISTYDVSRVREDFPILKTKIHGRPLVWLDNGATTQKPRAVIDRVRQFYEHENSNIHRAAHALAARATDAYEKARELVARFINAKTSREIVFVRGGTEAINLVAQTWGRENISSGDEILVTHLEHHANIVPWQQLAVEKGAHIKVAPVDENGQIILSEYAKLLGPRTRLVSAASVSNVLGTVTPLTEMISLAKANDTKFLVDAAQSIAHMPTDVQLLGCDWLVFSGHKMYAPTGIGVLYGREELLNQMSPWQGGGNMIQDVTFEQTTYHAAPARFEAGTGNIADAVGLGAAIEYLQQVGIASIGAYEHQLLSYAMTEMRRVRGLRLIGTPAEKAGVLAFVIQGIPNEQIGKALDQQGIAVRFGHHCAQPIHRRFGLESTVRASLGMYNTKDEIDVMLQVLHSLAR